MGAAKHKPLSRAARNRCEKWLKSRRLVILTPAVRYLYDRLPPDDADSAVNEGLVHAAARYKPRLGLWVPYAALWVRKYLIQQIKTATYWKHNRRQEYLLGTAPAAKLHDEFAGFDDVDRKQLVESLIGPLPPKYQELLIRRFYGGESFPKISEVLGVHRETLRQQCLRSLDKIARQWAQPVYERKGEAVAKLAVKSAKKSKKKKKKGNKPVVIGPPAEPVMPAPARLTKLPPPDELDAMRVVDLIATSKKIRELFGKCHDRLLKTTAFIRRINMKKLSVRDRMFAASHVRKNEQVLK